MTPASIVAYAILGVPDDASLEQVRSLFWERVKFSDRDWYLKHMAVLNRAYDVIIRGKV